MTEKILKNNIVRIKIDNNNFGSGVIFNNPDELNFLYVFTAKHVIYKNLDAEKLYKQKVAIDDVIVQYSLNNDNFLDFKVLDIIESKFNDFAILIISRKDYSDKIDVSSFRIVKKIEHLKDTLIFKGFPQKLECKEPHKINAKLNETRDLVVELKCIDGELFDFEDSALHNSKGFSGSGLFIQYPSNTIELAGIITEYKGFNSLKGYFFPLELNSLLNKNGYKPIIDLIEKPKNKKKTKVLSKPNFVPTEYYKDIKGENLNRLKKKIFPLIHQGLSILILGPDILNEKENLSQIFIDTYNKKFHTGFSKAKDVTEFVDVVFSNQGFSRTDFDDVVFNCLNNKSKPDLYNQISKIQWKAIITTNPDKFLGQAYDDNKEKIQDIIHVSKRKEFKTGTLPDSLQLIKLNGDIRDRGKYPLIFSTKDFERVEKFYTEIKGYLNGLSSNVPIIAIGFHQDNDYAQKLLNRLLLDRAIYSVDSTISDFRLNSAKEANKYIIKTSPISFFNLYNQWLEEEDSYKVRKNKHFFVNKEDKPIHISNDIRLRLNNNVIQIGGRSRYDLIKQKEFYEGLEANYSVIENDYDVPKRKKLDEVKKSILNSLNTTDDISLCILTGDFGTGKSTFTLRLIKEVISENPILAFHVLDFGQLKVSVINELLGRSNCKKIILYTDHIEKDSSFNALFSFFKSFQADFNLDTKVIILSSIRENIFNKLNRGKVFKNVLKTININASFTWEEVESLVEKWQRVKICQYRDSKEKWDLINRIVKEYKGDTLTASYNLIDSSKHSQYIIDAYNQLSEEMKEAFIFTSLLHRFKILMPFELLKNTLGKDTKEFEEQIIRGEGFGIINHETISNVTGLNPDLYFSTRHSTIAEKLIGLKLSNQNKQSKYYDKLIKNFKNNEYYSKEAVNLLTALDKTESLSQKFIDKLFDTASIVFELNPHFTLHYAMNLQKRDRKRGGGFNNTKNLEKANNVIQYVRGEIEESIYKRNHFLIHRQGVIAFNLAEFYLADFDINNAKNQLNAAKEYFETKKNLDPDSIYSYLDFIKLNLWILDNSDKLELDNFDITDLKNTLEILFDEANFIYEDKTSKLFKKYCFKNIEV